MLNPVTLILIILSGFFGGVFVGIASGTAAVFVIPCLTVFLGYSIHQATGTNLFVDCVIGGVAGSIFLLNKNVELRSTSLLVVTGGIGAFMGSRFTSAAPEYTLTVFIGLFLIAIGISFLVNGIRKNVKYIESKINFRVLRNHKLLSITVFGFIVGLISGFSGIGGSGMVAILLIFVLGYGIHTAIGTSLFMMFFIAGSGALSHMFNNELLFDAALIAGGAAATGAVFGGVFANNIDEDKLGGFIGAVVLLSGALMLIKAFVNI